MSSKINRESNLYKQLLKCYESVLDGTMICFDPSTGSTSSMPGYAIFKAGELVESGIISVNPTAKRNKKLFSITNSLLTEFPKPDVIVIENIPPVTYKKDNAMGGWSLVAIQRAIGAIVSCFDCDYIEMASSSWQKYKFDGYTKSDEHDSICIGLCAIANAEDIREVKSAPKKQGAKRG